MHTYIRITHLHRSTVAPRLRHLRVVVAVVPHGEAVVPWCVRALAVACCCARRVGQRDACLGSRHCRCHLLLGGVILSSGGTATTTTTTTQMAPVHDAMAVVSQQVLAHLHCYYFYLILSFLVNKQYNQIIDKK